MWIEDGQSRFEDSVRPEQHLKHLFLVIICLEPSYVEDILKEL